MFLNLRDIKVCMGNLHGSSLNVKFGCLNDKNEYRGLYKHLAFFIFLPLSAKPFFFLRYFAVRIIFNAKPPLGT